MKRISYSSLAIVVMAAGLLAAGIAFAADGLDCVAPVHTPIANGAVLDLRVFNDCPGSTLLGTNNYPHLIDITDTDEGCVGWANRSAWSFSEDGGLSRAVFENCSHYRFSATLVIQNSGCGVEAGLRVSPWWSPLVDGVFMARVPDGEISCWGGRLPFYNFTAAYGIRYVAERPIWMEIAYNPHSLTQADPATIRYTCHYQGVTYTSGELPFDQGNPAEPHGLWGELYPTTVGGYAQAPNGNGGALYTMQASWWDIQYYHDYWATPTTNTTWGKLKTLYR